MAENSGLLIVGIILIVLITAGLTYYVARQGAELPPANQTNQTIYPPTISMRGEASKTVMPDLLTIGFTVDSGGSTTSEAQAANAKEVAKLKAALIASGVNESEIQTSSYYTNPVYNDSCYKCGPYPIYEGDGGYAKPMDAAIGATGSGVAVPDYYPMPPYPCRQDNCSIIGYMTTHVLLVKSGKVNNGGKIVEAALGATNATSVDYIYFSLKEETRISVESDLQAAAAMNAKQKAENIAKGLGSKLGKIVSVSTDYYPYYPPMYAYQKDMMGGTAVPATVPTDISPTDSTMSSSISVVYELVQ
jgi:uncharacterized protein YggE